MIKVVVIDDHPLVRKGVEIVASIEEDIEVIGYASNGTEAVKMLEKNKPDVALVDLRLPGEHGLDIVRRAKKNSNGCRFIILTSYATEEEIRAAMLEQVDGYILKEALPEELISAIRLVSRGRRYYDPVVVQYAMDREGESEADRLDHLTRREQEVLAALSRGLNNKSIAQHLFISEHTVKKHISQILEKLNLQDRTQAALFGVSIGLNTNNGNCTQR